MHGNLANSILSVCSLLNKHSVEYLIVGGTAVALHGYYRKSTDSSGQETNKPDLDFWYNPTYKNYFALLNALKEFGQDISRYQEEQTPEPKKSYFRFDLPQFCLDFLPCLKASISFRQAFNKRETISFSGINLSLISLEHLLQDKSASGRPKDIRDINKLSQNTSEEK